MAAPMCCAGRMNPRGDISGRDSLSPGSVRLKSTPFATLISNGQKLNAGVHDASAEEIFSVNALALYVPHTKTKAIDLVPICMCRGAQNWKVSKLNQS